MLNKLTRTLSLALLTVVGLGTVGCANNTENGALAGGAAGAGLGAIIGNNSHGRRIQGSALWVRSPGHRRRCPRRERWPWPTHSRKGSQYEDRYYDHRDYDDRPVYREDDYYYRRY